MQNPKDKIEPGDPQVVIHRILNHSSERVYDAWTNPQYLIQWYAPIGCTIRFSKIEVKEGGTFHSCIENPTFGDCWVIGIYLELKHPEKIVFTMTVADESGKPVEPSSVGHDPDWAPESTVMIILKELGPKKTELILHQNVSEKLARKTGAYPSWLQMFDKLDALLSSFSHTEGVK